MVKDGETNTALRDLQALFEVGAVGGLSDEHLLGRFVARREPAVFEAIVRRHGPMVWGVCRRVLRDHHDAEDAFQATFLVLARRAASVLPREKLGPWLYGVAHRTATKARATRARRRAREVTVPVMPEPERCEWSGTKPAGAPRPGVEPSARGVPHRRRPLRI
jgi:RNA polymerase sigma-70 factor (ECF subfamily)